MAINGGTGIAGAINYFGSAKNQWHGFMMSIDTFPPYFLPFTFPPRELNDDFSPEFSHVRQPAGRYSFPVYLGMGQRTITFKLGFDASFSVPGGYRPPWEVVSPNQAECNDSFTYAFPISAVMSFFEFFKMPKPNLGAFGQAIASVFSAGILIKPDTAEPAPPLILLSTGVTKFYLGYLAEAKITQLKHTAFMMCTRMEVACKFLVTPDLVFTTAEDVARQVAMAVDSFRLG